MSQLKALEIEEIPVEKIKPSPYQPRLDFELEDLRGSIIRYGIQDPLKVRKVGNYYELIDGERRWRIAQQEGIETVPCLILEYSDEDADALAWRFNTERKQYSLEERAKHFKTHQDEGLSGAAIGRIHGYSSQQVNLLLSIFRLPEKYQNYLWTNEFAYGKFEYMYNKGLMNAKERQVPDIIKIIDEAVERRLTQREFENVVDDYLSDLEKRQIDEAKKAASQLEASKRREKKTREALGEPEVKPPETSEEFEDAAQALLDEAKRRKTPEQIEEEKLEKKRGQARNALLTGRGNAKSKIEAAKEEGIDTSEFEKRLEEIEAKILTNPDEAILESKELKNKIDETRNEIRERVRAKKDIENKIRRALDLGIDVSDYKQRLADLVANDTIKDEKESFIEEIDGAIHTEEVKREKEEIRKDAQAEVDHDVLEDVVISDPEEAERILIWQSTEGLTEEDRKSLVTKAETMGWSPKSLGKITKTLIDMDPNNKELILADNSSMGQREIIELGTVKDSDLQKMMIEYIQKFELGSRRAVRVIQRAKVKDYAWEEPERRAPIGLDNRLLGRIESSFYNMRGIGFPSMVIMGQKKWKEAKIYVRGLMDWCGYLLNLNLELQEDNQPSEPDISYVPLDEYRVKIIEAEYRVVDERAKS